MIHHAMKCITDVADAYLKLRTQSPGSEQMVYLTNVTTGEEVAIPDNSIGLSLVNIEEERVYKDQSTRVVNGQGEVEYRNPELKLNLFVLFSANFTRAKDDQNEDYLEGLKQLSYIIELFQAKNVFTQENTPALALAAEGGEGLPSNAIRKLVVELYSYSFEQMYNFWSVLGAPYLPSVLYRVRMLTVQQGDVSMIDPMITQINLASKTK